MTDKNQNELIQLIQRCAQMDELSGNQEDFLALLEEDETIWVAHNAEE